MRRGGGGEKERGDGERGKRETDRQTDRQSALGGRNDRERE